ncbi:hypothetical protein ACFX13_035562 [Malus domestica]
MRHVTRWCKDEILGEMASNADMETMYAFKRLDVKYDLKGNWILERCQQLRLGFGNMHRRSRERNGSASSSTWKAFNDSLIGPEGVIALEARSIVLKNHPKEGVVVGVSNEVLQPSHYIDLNIPIVVEQEWLSGTLPKMEVVGAGLGDGLLSQDSDPFNLLPIIEAVMRGGAKGSREEDDETLEIFDEGLYCVKKNPRSKMDQAEPTY